MRFILVALLSIFISPVFGQECTYSTKYPNSAPVGHSHVVMRGPTVNKIEGRLFDVNESPITHTIPIVVLSRIVNKEAKFIGGTFADEGRFCFGVMPEGKYKIEISAAGFKNLELLITVSRRGFSATKLKILLEVDD